MFQFNNLCYAILSFGLFLDSQRHIRIDTISDATIHSHRPSGAKDYRTRVIC